MSKPYEKQLRAAVRRGIWRSFDFVPFNMLPENIKSIINGNANEHPKRKERYNLVMFLLEHGMMPENVLLMMKRLWPGSFDYEAVRDIEGIVHRKTVGAGNIQAKPAWRGYRGRVFLDGPVRTGPVNDFESEYKYDDDHFDNRETY